MTEPNSEETVPIKAVEQQIWTVFDILRSESIASEEYNVVLFLLSLYKDGVISKNNISKQIDLHEHLSASIHDSTKLVTKQYLPIYQSFEPALKRLSLKGLNSIFTVLYSVDKTVLSSNFQEIFDSVLYRISQSQGRHAGEYIQPLELTRFICALTSLPKKSAVYNPFAGLASLAVCPDQNHAYSGQEINQKTWSLGTLRLMAYEKQPSSSYLCEDSILNWPAESKKFDLILAHPPYGMRISQQYREAEPGIRTIEQFLIEKGIKSLSEKGKLIALLPQGFLFRGMHEQRLREHLIEEDLIDTIISLPGGLLQNTGIPLVVLLVDKNKKQPGKVRFIEAKNFVESKGPREKILNDAGLNSLVKTSHENSETVRIIDNSQIREFDYNLYVPRYFQKQIQGVKLGDILDYFNGQKGNLTEGGKLIHIKDLKDDNVDFKLDLSNVEKSQFPRPQLRLIDESCLLLATRWKTLKPTLFKFSETPIFLNHDILSFKVNEKLADKAYLINELHADYVQEQLDSYRHGSTIPIIRRDDLNKVVIKLPSLKEQKAKVQGIAELSDKIKALQRERDARARGKATSQFNEFASLKHTLGRPRQNILDWTDNLLHFLKGNPKGFQELSKSFRDFYDTDILSALQEIKRDVNFMTEVLEKGENGFIVEEFDKSTISLSDVNNLIYELSSNGFNFKIKKLLQKEGKLIERGIHGNKTLLKTLIDNLLTNAHKYGFEKTAAGNEVVFELKEVDDSLSIEVRNNGKPFPKNFDRDKYITKYSTADSISGSGLGGYDIHRIATEFKNADWELTLNADPIYPVIFKFKFPIKLIN